MNDPRPDDYLWDPASPPDPEVARLERALGPLRFDSRALDVEHLLRRADGTPAVREGHLPVPRGTDPLDAPHPHGPRTRGRWAGVAGALCGALAAAAALLLVPRTGLDLGGWSIEGGEAHLARHGHLLEAVGGDLRLTHADLGTLDLARGSRLAALRTEPGAHRFELLEGRLHAEVIAEPRVFQVGSPAGLTVDLGCEYTLTVVGPEEVELEVLTGQVAFTQGGREVYVPAGASCRSTVDRGPTPPLFDDARPELVTLALAAHRGDLRDLKVLAATKTLIDIRDREEALPLFALLFDPEVDAGVRGSIESRLSTLFRRPPEVTREAVLACDPAAREAWLEDLRPWWRRGQATKGARR